MAMDPDRTLRVVEQLSDPDRARRNLRPRARLAVGPASGRGGAFSDDFRPTSSSASGSTVRLTLEPKESTGVRPLRPELGTRAVRHVLKG